MHTYRDAFQFAWVLEDSLYGMHGTSHSEQKAQMADAALRSFVRIVMEVSCSYELLKHAARQGSPS